MKKIGSNQGIQRLRANIPLIGVKTVIYNFQSTFRLSILRIGALSPSNDLPFSRAQNRIGLPAKKILGKFLAPCSENSSRSILLLLSTFTQRAKLHLPAVGHFPRFFHFNSGMGNLNAQTVIYTLCVFTSYSEVPTKAIKISAMFIRARL